MWKMLDDMHANNPEGVGLSLKNMIARVTDTQYLAPMMPYSHHSATRLSNTHKPKSFISIAFSIAMLCIHLRTRSNSEYKRFVDEQLSSGSLCH